MKRRNIILLVSTIIIIFVSVFTYEICLKKAKYFPDGVFGSDGVSITYRYDYFSDILKQFGEPSLYNNSAKKDYISYRFLLLRSLHVGHYNVMRIDISPQKDSGTLYYKSIVKATDKIDMTFESALSKENIDEFYRIITNSDYWNMKTNDGKIGLDGSEWVIEGADNGKYHVVRRFSPDDNSSIKKMGLYFISLSKIDIEDIY